MKKSSIFIWITLILFTLAMGSMFACDEDIGNGPIDCYDLDCSYFELDAPVEPAMEDLEACTTGLETPDLLVWLDVNDIVTGLPAELLDDNPENDPEDFRTYIGEVVVMETPLTDIICSDELVDIVGKLGLYLEDGSEANKGYLTNSFNNLIDLVVDWTAIKAAAGNITDLLTWEQVACLGSTLSGMANFLMQDANSTWVQDEVDAMLAELDLSGAQDFLDILGLTEDDLNGVLAIAAEEVQKLVDNLLGELIQNDQLPYLLALMKSAADTEPTQAQIDTAIDELVPLLNNNIIPSVVDTLTALLDALPDLAKDNVSNLINNLSPSTLINMILGLIGLPSCS
jgi:hypothetical protein